MWAGFTSRSSFPTGVLCAKVCGDYLELLERKAQKIKNVIGTVPGVADLGVFQAGNLPQLQIRVDRDAAARYGLNISDVQTVVETAIGGKVTTALWEGEKRFG